MPDNTPRRGNTPALRPDVLDSIQAAMQSLEKLSPKFKPLTLEQLHVLPDERIEATRRKFGHSTAVLDWMPASLDSEKLAHDLAAVDRMRRIRQTLQESVDALEAGTLDLDEAAGLEMIEAGRAAMAEASARQSGQGGNAADADEERGAKPDGKA